MITSRRLPIDRRYLHIPVRYDARAGLMRVHAGGRQVLKFAAKVTAAHPDYVTFADLEPFRGQTLELTFDSGPEPGVALDGLALADALPDAGGIYRERYRPQCHFSSRRGFINDPNGLVYFAGEYHLFYQHQPFGTDIGHDLKFWGHAVSRDLVHWEELPPALAPDEHGAMYSGSAVVDWHNTSGLQSGDDPPLVALYTADGRSADEVRPFTQCLAYSNDRGRTWRKHPDNPVLPHIAGLNRDPRVFWHRPQSCWVMVLYLDGDRFALLTSPNLWSCPSFVDTLGVRRNEEATMPKTHRPYAPEFRQQMVELVQSGRTPEELALEYEPSAGAIRNWVAQQERDAGRREDGLSSDERQELRRLRRENKQLRIERDILKKAAAWFARESDSIPERGSSS